MEYIAHYDARGACEHLPLYTFGSPELDALHQRELAGFMSPTAASGSESFRWCMQLLALERRHSCKKS